MTAVDLPPDPSAAAPAAVDPNIVQTAPGPAPIAEAVGRRPPWTAAGEVAARDRTRAGGPDEAIPDESWSTARTTTAPTDADEVVGWHRVLAESVAPPDPRTLAVPTAGGSVAAQVAAALGSADVARRLLAREASLARVCADDAMDLAMNAALVAESADAHVASGAAELVLPAWLDGLDTTPAFGARLQNQIAAATAPLVDVPSIGRDLGIAAFGDLLGEHLGLGESSAAIAANQLVAPWADAASVVAIPVPSWFEAADIIASQTVTASLRGLTADFAAKAARLTIPAWQEASLDLDAMRAGDLVRPAVEAARLAEALRPVRSFADEVLALQDLAARTAASSMAELVEELSRGGGVIRSADLVGDLLADLRRWQDWAPIPPELAPGSYHSDFYLLDDPDASPAARQGALDRMADRFAWVRSRRRVKAALPRRSRELGVSPRELLRHELQAAFLLVLGTRGQPQTIRFDREWVVDERGKRVPVPPDELEAAWYHRWFRIAVVRTVERSLAERTDRVPTPEAEAAERIERRSVRLPEGWEDERPAAPDDDPLVLLVEGVEREEARQRLAVCLNAATPKQREVLTLLAQGLTYGEVAARLGTTQGNVRTQLTLLRKRLKAA